MATPESENMGGRQSHLAVISCAFVFMALGFGLFVGRGASRKERENEPAKGFPFCEIHSPGTAGVAGRPEGPLASDPDNGSEDQRLKSALMEKLCMEGMESAQHGSIDDAVTRFQEALLINPEYGPARANLGCALMQKGDLSGALAHLREAVRLDPESVEAHFTFGLALMKQLKYSEAAEQFAQVVHSKPGDLQARLNLGLIQEKQGKIAEAVDQFREIIRLDPSQLPVARQLAWYLATYPDHKVRNAAEAIELAERVDTATNSLVPKVLDTLAAAYAEAGRFEDAERTAGSANKYAKALQEKELVIKVAARLALYKQHLPYHEKVEPQKNGPPSAN